MKKIPAVHPGEILLEYDIDMAMDNHELATTIDKIVPVNA